MSEVETEKTEAKKEKDPLEKFEKILNRFVMKCNTFSNYCSSALRVTKGEIVDVAKSIGKDLKDKDDIDALLMSKKVKAIIEKIETYNLIPESIFLMLVANFDLFLSSLLKEVILEKEDIQKGINKEISFKDITVCEKIEDVKEIFVNDYIDDIMRKSHNDQIDWLEKQFKLKIINDFKSYEQFIYLTEVRNIVAHKGSIIDISFINNLKKHKVHKSTIEKLKINERFGLTPKFLYKNINLMIHFAIFLYTKLLRNIYKKSTDSIDNHINAICYECLQEKRYNLVISILEERLNSSDKYVSMTKYLYLINLCIAYSRSGNTQKFNELLSKEDWSNCDDKFKLAKAVLENNETEYIKYIKKLKDEIEELEYREWPLFEEIKKKEVFLNTFKEVFGKDFEDNIEEEKIAGIIKESEKIEREISDSLESEKLIARTTD